MLRKNNVTDEIDEKENYKQKMRKFHNIAALKIN